MTELTEWQKIAKELGDYDLNDVCNGYDDCGCPTGLILVGDHGFVGNWVNAEIASKEILRLRERVMVLERVREAGSKVESLMDDPEHESNDYYACKSLIWPRQASCDCGAQDQLDAMDELRKALTAAKPAEHE